LTSPRLDWWWVGLSANRPVTSLRLFENFPVYVPITLLGGLRPNCFRASDSFRCRKSHCGAARRAPSRLKSKISLSARRRILLCLRSARRCLAGCDRKRVGRRLGYFRLCVGSTASALAVLNGAWSGRSTRGSAGPNSPLNDECRRSAESAAAADLTSATDSQTFDDFRNSASIDSLIRLRITSDCSLVFNIGRCLRHHRSDINWRPVCSSYLPLFDPILGVLAVPRCRLSTLGPRAFSVAGPLLWNALQNSFRDPDLGRDNVRRLLKTHLFTPYRSI